ncbi:MAG: Dipeptide transport system permease protein DppB [Tenericutes bacterium ADurb.Bin239]|nr:MAG: Dipeptide transport system permease protein DppB [Tenericutes bacterium ADurb.Bin239]
MKEKGKAKEKVKEIAKNIGHFFFKYRFLWRRIGFALVSLFFAVLLTFFVLTLIPNNSVDEYALQIMMQRNISFEEAYHLAIQILGYNPNENVFVQFWHYIVNLSKGNLGTSIRFPGVTANSIIKQFLPYTLFISSLALVVSFVIGIVLGSKMASKRSRFFEVNATSFILVSSSVPDYIWALLLLFVFSNKLGWFPMEGARDLSNDLPGWIDLIWHSVLPVVSMVIVQISGWALTMRGSCVAVLGEDYVNAAKARGIPKRIIDRRYLRRNAILPLVTSIAISFAALFGGSTLIESMFNFPGLGLQLASHIGIRDYYVVVGILFFTSSIIVLANLIADSIYSLIDPRIRRSS